MSRCVPTTCSCHWYIPWMGTVATYTYANSESHKAVNHLSCQDKNWFLLLHCGAGATLHLVRLHVVAIGTSPKWELLLHTHMPTVNHIKRLDHLSCQDKNWLLLLHCGAGATLHLVRIHCTYNNCGGWLRTDVVCMVSASVPMAC